VSGGKTTVLEALRAGERWLLRRGVDEPRRSLELLLAHVLAIPRLQVYLQHDRPLDARELGELRALLARRGQHEPIAYLLGRARFRDLDLDVDRRVLVPRPETEHLVTLALERLPPGGRVVDLGTGSGALAIAIASERKDARVWAVDCSEQALAVARRNAGRHQVLDRVHFARGDFWQPLCGVEPFDLLVSNPPYVDPSRPDLIGKGVLEHEPAVALFTAHGDPASCYRQIVAGADRGLREGAWLVLETGCLAAPAAQAVLTEAPFLTGVELRDDAAGMQRYALARRSGWACTNAAIAARASAPSSLK
jgi:release factor glutamine methyltransferase